MTWLINKLLYNNLLNVKFWTYITKNDLSRGSERFCNLNYNGGASSQQRLAITTTLLIITQKKKHSSPANQTSNKLNFWKMIYAIAKYGSNVFRNTLIRYFNEKRVGFYFTYALNNLKNTMVIGYTTWWNSIKCFCWYIHHGENSLNAA